MYHKLFDNWGEKCLAVISFYLIEFGVSQSFPAIYITFTDLRASPSFIYPFYPLIPSVC